MKKSSTKIKLKKIIGEKKQIDTLFHLLKKRKYNISNLSVPTYKEHAKFVKNNPYRVWYLINIDNVDVGTLYIMKNNCIGISLLYDLSVLSYLINLVIKKHKPLREIKSVRPPYFFVNVSAKNTRLKSELLKVGALEIQSSYSLVRF